jgi:hypothetical protein
MNWVLRAFVLGVAVPPVGMVGVLTVCCFRPLAMAYPFVLFLGLPAASAVYLGRVQKRMPTKAARVCFAAFVICSSLATWLVLLVLSIPY